MSENEGWRYSINYGPEGEANYAMVYDAKGELVSNLKTYHAIAVVNAMNALSRPDGEAIAGTGGVRFKPLEWSTALSGVTIAEDAFRRVYTIHSKPGEMGCRLCIDHERTGDPFPSEKAAKAAGQANHDACILASLANDAPSIAAAAQGEAVGWLVVHKASGRQELEFKPPADMPFNRERFTWEPLCRASCSATVKVAPHPLAAFPDGLQPGLYRIHWKSGGASEAAIGMQSDGSRWIAPTNWIRPGMVASASEWADIERADRLATPPAPARAPEPAATQAEIETRMVIRLEKLLCEKLGREWTPAGISVVSLVDELASRTALASPATHVKEQP